MSKIYFNTPCGESITIGSLTLAYPYILWRITDSNRWPPACKAGALASWANPPWGVKSDKVKSEEFNFQLSTFNFQLLTSAPQRWVVPGSSWTLAHIALRRCVVPGRLELPTSTLSVWRSNQLSYRTVSIVLAVVLRFNYSHLSIKTNFKHKKRWG